MNKINISIRDLPRVPKRLQQLPQPPKKLRLAGENLDELISRPVVGIVGSRKVSGYGRSVTEDFAASLARKGIIIVSGLALGVDSIAHRACLEAGGRTIAVLPSGITNIYPAAHTGLSRRIIETGGTLISEYPDGDRPMRHSFIERNRIIAGLSDVLLVTEAAEKSGSLYTAQFALDQGKSVFAVPGNITSPTSRGTNNLIDSGALMALKPENILEELGIASSTEDKQSSYIPENPLEKLLLDLINNGVEDGDRLLSESGLDARVFQQNITLLEIKGVLKPLGNNRWRTLQ